MAVNQTEICNLALARIGADRIVDLATDSDRNARFCGLFYDQTLEEILRARPWQFAIQRASLARSTTAPAFGWAYQYPLPSDCIQILECNGKDWWRFEQEEFAIESGHVLTDAETAEVRYVYRNTNAASYPADFVEALATLLASKLCAPLTGNAQLGRALMEEYEVVKLPRAGAQSGNESRGRRVNRILESDLVKAR